MEIEGSDNIQTDAETKSALSLLDAVKFGNLNLTKKYIREGANLDQKNSAGQSVSDLVTDDTMKKYLTERSQREADMTSVLSAQGGDLEKQFPSDAQELKHLLSASLIYQKITEERAKSAIKMLLEEKYHAFKGWKEFELQCDQISSTNARYITDLKTQIRELHEIATEQQTFFSQILEGQNDSKSGNTKVEASPKSGEQRKEDIILVKNDNGQMKVKSATIEKLIERLLDPSIHDNHFTQTLLLNHKSICESQQLLDWITVNFKLNSKETLPRLLKSINIMKYWIEQFWSDFQSDEQLLTKLSNAIAGVENAKLADTLRNLLSKKMNSANEAPLSPVDTADQPKPILPKHLQLSKKVNAPNAAICQKALENIRLPGSNYSRDPNSSFATTGSGNSSAANASFNASFNANVSFSDRSGSSNPEDGGKLRLADLDPLEVARQLTLIEFEFFTKVKPREFTGLAWMKDDKDLRAPNITKMVRWSNHVIKWLITEIVSIRESPKARAIMMEKIVMIAKHCDSLNNFNAVKEIMAALQSSSVGRLKKTKEAMNSKHVKLMEDLMSLTSNEMNFKNLRTKIHSVEPPMIPFPGVYQGDLVFLESYGKDIQDGMVNFMKFQKVTTYVVELQVYQQAQFKLQPVPEIQEMIKEFLGLEEEPAYALSLICEPRNQQ